MDVRIYDVNGQTLARATLVKGADGKVPSIAAVVRLMRKGKVFLAEWEEPKQQPPAAASAAAKAAAEKAAADKAAAAGRQGGK